MEILKLEKVLSQVREPQMQDKREPNQSIETNI